MERRVTLHQDYSKVDYDISKHFVLSKVNYNNELNNQSASRIGKK